MAENSSVDAARHCSPETASDTVDITPYRICPPNVDISDVTNENSTPLMLPFKHEPMPQMPNLIHHNADNPPPSSICSSASLPTVATTHQTNLNQNLNQSSQMQMLDQNAPTSLRENTPKPTLSPKQQSPEGSSADAYPSQSQADTNYQAADSNSSKQTFVPCKVCGDKASGYHYGVTSCEGCKGFFRRSIQKQIEYRCLRDGKCMVIRLNRNRCQYCRFKKCLAVGMSRDSVRYGRVPKRTKSQEEQRVSTTQGQMEANALENQQLAIYDIILTVSQAYHANCQLTEDKIRNIEHKNYSLLTGEVSEGESCTPDASLFPNTDLVRLKMYERLAEIISPSIHNVVEFSKRLHGFQDLQQDDQLILIKTGFFEIWLLCLTRMFNQAAGTVTFENGYTVHRKELEVIFQEEFTESIFDYANNFSVLRLNDTEMGLFSGVVIATADRLGLNDTKSVEKIQDKLIEALRLQISRNHSTEPHMFANVLMKLPELRMIGSRHSDMMTWIRKHWAQLHLPPLFSEIFDVPKNGNEFEAEPPSS